MNGMHTACDENMNGHLDGSKQGITYVIDDNSL